MSDTGDTNMGGSQDKDDFKGLSSDETKDASPEATSPKRKKFKTSRRDAPDKDRSDDTADDKKSANTRKSTRQARPTGKKASNKLEDIRARRSRIWVKPKPNTTPYAHRRSYKTLDAHDDKDYAAVPPLEVPLWTDYSKIVPGDVETYPQDNVLLTDYHVDQIVKLDIEDRAKRGPVDFDGDGNLVLLRPPAGVCKSMSIQVV